MTEEYDPSKDTILIISKARDRKVVEFTIELAEWLIFTPQFGKEHPFTVYVDAHLNTPKLFQRLTHPAWQTYLKFWTPKLCYRQPNLFHLIITLGGDGTILFTSTLFQSHVPPIMPFHLGSLGFLAPFLFTSYRKELDNLFEKRLSKTRRMRLSCTVYRCKSSSDTRENKELAETEWIQNALGQEISKNTTASGLKSYSAVPGQTFHVLNEIVIDRGPSSNMSLLELFANDRHLTTVQADGLCIATATGSTAYSLSANGSLTHPDMHCTLVTPLCPHTLSFRPMILPSTMIIRVVVPFCSRHTAHCRLDGRNTIELKQGDHVKITMSPYPVYTYASTDVSNDWFSSVQTCLQWNVRKRQTSAIVSNDSLLSKDAYSNNRLSENEQDGIAPWTEQELEKDSFVSETENVRSRL
ncbi:unnamed protein product [Rhizopus microsporus]